MYNSNDIFSEIFEIIRKRNETCFDYIEENLSDQNANAFFTGISVGYCNILEYLEDLKNKYISGIPPENNNN